MTKLIGDRRVDTNIEADHSFGHVKVTEDYRLLHVEIRLARGAEAELALCLKTLVDAGVLDSGRLRAALALADPPLADHPESVEPPQLGAVCRIVFLHGKENPGSVVFREATEELAKIGLVPT